MQSQQMPATEDEARSLNKRLETISWGLFLIVLGGSALVPDRLMPDGIWMVAAGLILIGLNAVRYFNHIPMSNFTLILGVIALVSGISDMLGADLPIFALVLILIGAVLLIRPLIEKPKQIT